MQNISSILMFDPIVEDRIYKMSQARHDDLVRRYKLNARNKQALDLDPMRELLAELSDLTPRLARGGSGSTIAFTLKRIFPRIDIRFGSLIGGTDYSDTIRADFEREKIKLLLPVSQFNISPQHAITCMLVPESGGRTIATYPGTLGKIIKPDVLSDRLVGEADVVHLLATNREEERLGKTFVDRLLTLRWDHGKDLWLNLPTHQDFSVSNSGYFRWLVPSANLVLGNMDELKWVYGTSDNQTALKSLQQAFTQNATRSNAKGGDREQIAFITNDKFEACTVTSTNIVAIPAKQVRDADIVNNGGAGDTALAGFIAGYNIQGLVSEKAARIGHALAARKLRQYDPCLENPLQSLKEDEPELFRALTSSWMPRIIAGDRHLAAGM